MEPLPKHLDPTRMTLRDLIGIANAIEQEAVGRYSQLADLMERRGETATAQAFRRMLAEERKHVAAVEQWAHGLHQSVPPAATFQWRLPAELSASWDEIAGSALLTPYRALAIAVRNEERAFSMYSYLAAHAQDPAVAAEAEKLAVEALRHAALLRRWRRSAYHVSLPRVRRLTVDTVEELRSLISDRQAAIAEHHRALAEQLRGLGDDDGARVLEADLPELSAPAPARAAAASKEGVLTPSRLSLLVAAQKPLEAFSEELETILATAAEPVSAEAEKALSSVIARLAHIAYFMERRT